MSGSHDTILSLSNVNGFNSYGNKFIRVSGVGINGHQSDRYRCGGIRGYGVDGLVISGFGGYGNGNRINRDAISGISNFGTYGNANGINRFGDGKARIGNKLEAFLNPLVQRGLKCVLLFEICNPDDKDKIGGAADKDERRR